MKTAAGTLLRFRILVLAVRKKASSMFALPRVETAAGTLLRFRSFIPAMGKKAGCKTALSRTKTAAGALLRFRILVLAVGKTTSCKPAVRAATRTLYWFRSFVPAVRKKASSMVAGPIRAITAAGTLLRFRILVLAVGKTTSCKPAVRATTRTLWQPWGTWT